jgi:hypothetical protein
VRTAGNRPDGDAITTECPCAACEQCRVDRRQPAADDQNAGWHREVIHHAPLGVQAFEERRRANMRSQRVRQERRAAARADHDVARFERSTVLEQHAIPARGLLLDCPRRRHEMTMLDASVAS